MSSLLSQARQCVAWSFGRQGMMILLLLTLLNTPAAAQTFDEAEVLYDSGDYATAFEAFRVLAEQGDARAQNWLGFRYTQGEGIPQDDAEAMRWYRLAAEQGLAAAQYNLGLGYAEGRGIPQDYTEAVRWCRLAAEQGVAKAQGCLGIMYDMGWGIPKDDIQAHKWFNLAASRLSSSDQERDSIVKKRIEVEVRMTPAQIAEAQRLAREWRPKQSATSDD